MFKTPLFHFADVPCPCLETCNVPNCIFEHEPKAQSRAAKEHQIERHVVKQDEESKRILAQTPRSPRDESSNDIDDSAPKRKRAKNNPDRRTATETRQAEQPSRNFSEREIFKEQNTGRSFENARAKPVGNSTQKLSEKPSKPVSPPPLRRNPNITIKSGASPVGKQILNPRPVPGSTAPHQTRYLLLKNLHAEMARLNREAKGSTDDAWKEYILSEAELIMYALTEEEKILKENSAVYANKMKMRLVAYKKMKPDQWIEERKQSSESLQTSQSGIQQPGRPLNVANLTPSESRQILRHLVADQKPLQAYGYVTSPPSDSDIKQAKRAVDLTHGWEECERCKSRFQVFPERRKEDGALTTGGECHHHPGRAIAARVGPEELLKGQPEKRYTCCNRRISDSATCTTATSHVFKISDVKRLASVLPFERTPENPKALKDRAVCFDCEMGYTTYGLELIRVSAIDWPTGDSLLDVLVKPLGVVLDLNTKYSGISPEQFTDVVTYDENASLAQMKNVVHSSGKWHRVNSPAVARALFFRLIAPGTPLIGHALENDLNTLRIVHPTIVDTVLLFPHRAGLPYRQSLQRLSEGLLQRKIQAGPGHDSKEDAVATGDLVKFKVDKEWAKMQAEGWKFVNGKLHSVEEETEGPLIIDPSNHGTKRRLDSMLE